MEHIPFEIGVVQGLGLSGIYLGVVQRLIEEEIKPSLPKIKNKYVQHSGFIDDETELNEANYQATKLRLKIKQSLKHGIHINKTKSVIHSSNFKKLILSKESMDTFKNFKKNNTLNMITLGVPDGDKKFIKSFYTNKVNNLRKKYNIIVQITNNQIKNHILINFFNINRVNYWMRNMEDESFLHDFVDLRHDIIQTLCNDTVTELSDNIACLPVNMGGLGMANPKQLNSAAYISSYSSNLTILSNLVSPALYDYGLDKFDKYYKKNIYTFNSYILDEKDLVKPSNNDLHQSKLNQLFYKNLYRQILENAPPRSKVLLRTMQSKLANAWLYVVNDFDGFMISNKGINLLYQTRLHVPILPRHSHYKCNTCNKPFDKYLDHCNSCNNNYLINTKHDRFAYHFNELIFKRLRLRTEIEQRSATQSFHDKRRPGDVMIIDNHERKSYVDFGFTYPIKTRSIGYAQSQSGYEGNIYYNHKRNHYKDLIRRGENIEIFVMEYYGLLHQNAKKLYTGWMRKLSGIMDGRIEFLKFKINKRLSSLISLYNSEIMLRSFAQPSQCFNYTSNEYNHMYE